MNTYKYPHWSTKMTMILIERSFRCCYCFSTHHARQTRKTSVTRCLCTNTCQHKQNNEIHRCYTWYAGPWEIDLHAPSCVVWICRTYHLSMRYTTSREIAWYIWSSQPLWSIRKICWSLGRTLWKFIYADVQNHVNRERQTSFWLCDRFPWPTSCFLAHPSCTSATWSTKFMFACYCPYVGRISNSKRPRSSCAIWYDQYW